MLCLTLGPGACNSRATRLCTAWRSRQKVGMLRQPVKHRLEEPVTRGGPTNVRLVGEHRMLYLTGWKADAKLQGSSKQPSQVEGRIEMEVWRWYVLRHYRYHLKQCELVEESIRREQAKRDRHAGQRVCKEHERRSSPCHALRKNISLCSWSRSVGCISSLLAPLECRQRCDHPPFITENALRRARS